MSSVITAEFQSYSEPPQVVTSAIAESAEQRGPSRSNQTETPSLCRKLTGLTAEP